MSELKQLRDDLNKTLDALTSTAQRIKQSGREAVNKEAHYESLKANYKIHIAAEDAASGSKARTVSLIESMYRLKYANERLAMMLSRRDYETDVLLYKGIMAKLNALQSVARLAESEMKLGANF